jgi:hypothetical protein
MREHENVSSVSGAEDVEAVLNNSSRVASEDHQASLDEW